ncbi:MAG: hypothetical protein IPO15_04765 [Anaerolineae bacterium]|uniref:hypothetical protein n=1 Tax=Candidatus Amarolinea dominans TaxID=3140696 RepID=UPI003134A783|nr:hypothetical protein [Anaerolineae bacterium]
MIEFNALVTNDRDNTSPDNGSAQQAGVSLDNTFQTAINSSKAILRVGSTSSANDFSRAVITRAADQQSQQGHHDGAGGCWRPDRLPDRVLE